MSGREDNDHNVLSQAAAERAEIDDLDRLLTAKFPNQGDIPIRRQFEAAESASHQSMEDEALVATTPKTTGAQALSIVRWGAFIPVGVALGLLSGIAAYFVFHVSSWLGGYPPDGQLNRLAVSALMGWATVYFGARIAPVRNKRLPTLACGTVAAVIAVAAITLGFTHGNWQESMEGTLALAGCGLATVQGYAIRDSR